MNPDRQPRNTSADFVKLLSSRQYLEILKILRRRTINAIRFVLRAVLRFFGVYYDSPWVQKKQLRRLLTRYYPWDKQNWETAAMRVALIIRDGMTYPKSSAFIRLLSPLADEGLRGKVALKIFPENTTDIGPDTDVCIVQRNAFDNLDAVETLTRTLSASGIPLVVDTDDAFHSMDASHSEHNMHHNRLEAFKSLVDTADQVWASTVKLAGSFKNTKTSVVVVRNSLDERVWQNKPHVDLAVDPDEPLQIVYMGTGTHDADFEMIFPALEKLASKHPGLFELTIIGVADDLPERVWIKRLHTNPNGSIYLRFVPWFLKQGPFDIGLAPLVDSAFNNYKSDIKCLDYLAAGIIPVVSDIEPYRSAQLDDYIMRVKNTTGAWEEKLSELIEKTADFRQDKASIILKAQKYLWSERSSSTTAKELLKLIEALKKSSQNT